MAKTEVNLDSKRRVTSRSTISDLTLGISRRTKVITEHVEVLLSLGQMFLNQSTIVSRPKILQIILCSQEEHHKLL
jgi:hypothetical protein